MSVLWMGVFEKKKKCDRSWGFKYSPWHFRENIDSLQGFL